MGISIRLDGNRLAPILALCLMVGSLVAQDIVVLDEIVARVNHEIITLTDLNEELAVLRSGLQREIQSSEGQEREFQIRKRELLKNLIQNKMLMQRAEELGISANIDVEVASTLERMRQESNIPNLEVMDQYLREQGSSLEKYRQGLLQRLTVDSLIQQFVYSKITLLTPEIEEYYQQNLARFTEPAEVELKEILLLTEGKEKPEVQKRAEEVLAKLRAGASFEESAKQYSEGPTANRGGGIGSFRRGSMSAPIEEVAFQLKEGEFSGIIETEYGLQVIQVEASKEPRERPLDEVRREITNELYQKKAQPGLREFIDSLRDDSYIFVAEKYSQEYDLAGL